MHNSISLLGSTGSVGRQTLEVAESLGISVSAVSADKSIKLLEEQVRKFKPEVAAVFNEDAARDFRIRVSDTQTRVVSGMDGLIEAARIECADTIVTAVAGTDGLLPTLAAIDEGKRIAIANKETLVCAGRLVMLRAWEKRARILPVDSEHSAIFQCIDINKARGVKNIILTGSGGPFRGWSREDTAKVTPGMALKHPNWQMGKKITIDSATLMNKGFEFIEAMHLFTDNPDRIKVIVHPQSVIHSMVEYEDNSVLAQLAAPDMRLPIQYALTYPDRLPSQVPPLDFSRIGGLTFEEPDLEAFPCLKLAIDTAGKQGTAGAALSGADDAAVELFLAGRIGFNEIYELVYAAVENDNNIVKPSAEEIIEAVRAAKRFVFERVK